MRIEIVKRGKKRHVYFTRDIYDSEKKRNKPFRIQVPGELLRFLTPDTIFEIMRNERDLFGDAETRALLEDLKERFEELDLENHSPKNKELVDAWQEHTMILTELRRDSIIKYYSWRLKDPVTRNQALAYLEKANKFRQRATPAWRAFLKDTFPT